MPATMGFLSVSLLLGFAAGTLASRQVEATLLANNATPAGTQEVYKGGTSSHLERNSKALQLTWMQ